MTDFGYSSDYSIFLTRNEGVQIVTNDLSLKILNEMRFREVSPTSMAMELGLPKSTIQANISKLLHMGILCQDENKEDSRGVIYRIDAIQVFGSYMDTKWQLNVRTASASRILSKGRCTSREDLSLYGVSLTESGLDIVQGLFSVGSSLMPDTPDYSDWESIKRNILKQSSDRGMKVLIEDRSGLKLKFRSEGDENIADVSLIVVPMLGGIVSRSKDLLGYHLSKDIDLEIEDYGREVTMTVKPFVGQDYVRSGFRHHNMSDFKVDQPFAIYSIDDKAVLFTNSTMISVLNSLTEGSKSVNELTAAIGIPKATVYASLVKLMEMGAINVDENQKNPKKYSLDSDPVLFCKEPEVTNCNKLAEIRERFIRGEIDYYSAVIGYAMEATKCMGVEFDRMFSKAGRTTAKSVIDLHPDITPQNFVDISCSMVSYPDQATVVSYIPLKIDVTLSPHTLWRSWPSYFVKGFIENGLLNLTGDKYKVTVETIRQGNEGNS
ncbi:ArsR family transcriptional regulator [methanogenic archaeon mixed culture ISO4-G1]|nr:ArsR family transcriptional regulator [methanogenic archaeon mixed culture ISO4-G1]